MSATEEVRTTVTEADLADARTVIKPERIEAMEASRIVIEPKDLGRVAIQAEPLRIELPEDGQADALE